MYDWREHENMCVYRYCYLEAAEIQNGKSSGAMLWYIRPNTKSYNYHSQV